MRNEAHRRDSKNVELLMFWVGVTPNEGARGRAHSFFGMTSTFEKQKKKKILIYSDSLAVLHIFSQIFLWPPPPGGEGANSISESVPLLPKSEQFLFNTGFYKVMML